MKHNKSFNEIQQYIKEHASLSDRKIARELHLSVSEVREIRAYQKEQKGKKPAVVREEEQEQRWKRMLKPLTGKYLFLNLFLLAFAVRLWYFSFLRQQPDLMLPLLDAEYYLDWAQRLARDGWLGSSVFFTEPLYAYLLAVFIKITHNAEIAMIGLQVLLGSFLSIVVYLLAEKVFNKTSALLAALVTAVYGPFIFYDFLLLKTSPETFFLTLLVYLLVLLISSRSRWKYFLTGLLLGLIVSLKGNVTMLLPGFVLFILLFYKPPTEKDDSKLSSRTSFGISFSSFWPACRQAWLVQNLFGMLNQVQHDISMRLLRLPAGRQVAFTPRNDKYSLWHTKLVLAGVFTLGVLLMIAPITIRNYIVGHDFVPTNYSIGIVVYGGNWWGNDGSFLAPGFVRPHPKYEETDMYRMAEAYSGKSLKPSEVSSFWTKKALGEVLDNPGRWVSMLGHKFLLFINKTELSDNYDYVFYAREIPLLRFLPGFWFIASLALASIVILGYRFIRRFRDRDDRFITNEQLLLLCIMLAYTALVFVGGVNSRYRLPLIPLFIIMATYGVWYMVSSIKQKSYYVFVGFLFLVLSSLFLTSVHLRNFDSITPANFYNLVGSYYMDRGEDGKAEEYFQKAIAERKEFEWSYGNLFTIYMRHGALGSAYDMLEESIRYRPDDYGNYVRLKTYHEVKSKPQAYIANRFRQQQSEGPGSNVYDPYYYEALRYLDLKQTTKAEENFYNSLNEYNEPLSTLVYLASLKKQQGDTEEAKAMLLTAVKRDVFFLPAQYNLANLYIKDKDPKMASLLLQHIYDFVPEYGEVWPYLAYQYLAAKDYGSALPVVQAYIKRYDGDPMYQAQVDRFKSMLVQNDASESAE